MRTSINNLLDFLVEHFSKRWVVWFLALEIILFLKMENLAALGLGAGIFFISFFFFGMLYVWLRVVFQLNAKFDNRYWIEVLVYTFFCMQIIIGFGWLLKNFITNLIAL
jgi:hypothetical protein